MWRGIYHYSDHIKINIDIFVIMKFGWLFALVTAAVAPAIATLRPGQHAEQIHVAIAGARSKGLAVSWLTQEAYPEGSLPTVRYGTDPNHLTEAVTGYSIVYFKSSNHHVVLPALPPDAKVYYMVGIETDYSAVFTAKAPPAQGA